MRRCPQRLLDTLRPFTQDVVLRVTQDVVHEVVEVVERVEPVLHVEGQPEHLQHGRERVQRVRRRVPVEIARLGRQELLVDVDLTGVRSSIPVGPLGAGYRRESLRYVVPRTPPSPE